MKNLSVKILLIFSLALWSFPTFSSAADDSSRENDTSEKFENSWEQLKAGFSSLGSGIKEGGKDTGRAIKKGGKKAGEGFEKAGEEIKDTFD